MQGNGLELNLLVFRQLLGFTRTAAWISWSRSWQTTVRSSFSWSSYQSSYRQFSYQSSYRQSSYQSSYRQSSYQSSYRQSSYQSLSPQSANRSTVVKFVFISSFLVIFTRPHTGLVDINFSYLVSYVVCITLVSIHVYSNQVFKSRILITIPQFSTGLVIIQTSYFVSSPVTSVVFLSVIIFCRHYYPSH